jgi:hypothetical protein
MLRTDPKLAPCFLMTSAFEYKSEISGWASSWFSEEARKDGAVFIEAEVQLRWKELVAKA